MRAWVIDESVGRSIAIAMYSGMSFSDEQRKDFDAKSIVALEGDPRNMSRAGASAEIIIEGVLTEKPDIWSWYFGGGNTTYAMIVRALGVAAQDPTIKEVMLRVNSPGGMVDGLWDALTAIDRFKETGKKLRVVASKAQSAAYAIAAYAGKIEAATVASMFGSIGTAIDITIYANEKLVSITNRESTDKRPDPETPEGRAVYEDFLDEFNEMFVLAIATGRGVETSVVTETFGRGRTFGAEAAKAKGMIDSFPKMKTAARMRAVDENVPTATDGGAPQQESRMKNIEELRAQHPELYTAAVAKGANDERDRVVSHLTMGEASGDMTTAVAAIKDGSGMTGALQAAYMAAGMKRGAISARQSESDAAGAALGGAQAPVAKTDDAPVALYDAAAAAIAKRRNGGAQ